MDLTPAQPADLVNTRDFGIKGFNYYWTRRDRYNMSEEELQTAGVVDELAYVHKDLVKPLQAANRRFEKLGYEILVKDAYRPPALYKLIQQKRYETGGKQEADRLLNMDRLAHSSGLAVDISLLDLKDGQELYLRDGKDDPEAWFIGFYKDKKDKSSQEFQRRQDMLIGTMLSCGWSLGTRNEYWHFEYLKGGA